MSLPRTFAQVHGYSDSSLAVLVALVACMLVPASVMQYQVEKWLMQGAVFGIPSTVRMEAPRLCAGVEEDALGHWWQRTSNTTSKFQAVIAAKAADRSSAPQHDSQDNDDVLQDCLTCARPRETWGYTRLSTCRRLSCHDAMKTLSSSLRSMTFIGDSFMEQLYYGAMWMHQAQPPVSVPRRSVNTFLRTYTWSCVPETSAFVGAAFRASKIARQESSSLRQSDILVLSFGQWYAFDANAGPCPCNPFAGMDDCFSEVEADIETPQADEWIACLSLQGRNSSCGKVRQSMCRDRRKQQDLNQCSYSRDLAHLARWVKVNRAQLPGHIFWLEFPALRSSGSASSGGPGAAWRSAISRAIWSYFAPNVRIVRTPPPLAVAAPPSGKVAGGSRSAIGPHQHCGADGQHWCFVSDAFEETLGSLLTAIIASSMPGSVGLVSTDVSDTPVAADPALRSPQRLQGDGGPVDLALGRLPSGPSELAASPDGVQGRFLAATDGNHSTAWQAGPKAKTSNLVLDLGAKAVISSMSITIPGGDKGFKQFDILRTEDPSDSTSWKSFRSVILENCDANRKSNHGGWLEPTRHIMLAMKERCGAGGFAVSSWEIFGITEEVLPKTRRPPRQRTPTAVPNSALNVSAIPPDPTYGRGNNALGFTVERNPKERLRTAAAGATGDEKLEDELRDLETEVR